MKIYLILEDPDDSAYMPHPLGAYSSRQIAEKMMPKTRLAILTCAIVELELDLHISVQEESIRKQLRGK